MTREPDISLSTERLLQCQEALGQLQEARVEIERLKEQLASLQASSGYEASIMQLEVERLTAVVNELWNELSYMDGDKAYRLCCIAKAALEPKP